MAMCNVEIIGSAVLGLNNESQPVEGKLLRSEALAFGSTTTTPLTQTEHAQGYRFVTLAVDGACYASIKAGANAATDPARRFLPGAGRYSFGISPGDVVSVVAA